MESKPINQQLTSKRKGRNNISSLFFNEKSKTISSKIIPPSTTRNKK